MADPAFCPVCKAPFKAYPMGSKNDYRLIGCSACGSVIADPWPTVETLETFYGDVQPEAVHMPNPTAEIASWGRLIGKLKHKVKGNTFLDVTAHQGYSVKGAEQNGMTAAGIDSHDFFVRFAHAQYGTDKFEHMTVQEAAAAGRKADLIICNEGFCEQPDLESFTAALAQLLNDGGAIFIREPDGNNFNIPRNFTHWVLVEPPLNFVYLSKKGLAKLLARHGLKVQSSMWTWAPFQRLVVVKK